MPADDTEVGKSFLRNPLSDKPFTEGMVPGIGPAGAAKLLDKHQINSPQQLMGYFLLLNRDPEGFLAFLASKDIQAKYAKIILEAMQAKSEQHCTDDAHDMKNPVKNAPAGTTKVAASFHSQPLSAKKLLPGVVPGLGEVSIKRVERKIRSKMGEGARPPPGTPTAVQLMGLYLAIGRNYERMKSWFEDECQCAARHAEETTKAPEHKAELMCDSALPGDGLFTPTRPTKPSLTPTPEGGEEKDPEEVAAVQRLAESSKALKQLLAFVLFGILAFVVVGHATVGFK